MYLPSIKFPWKMLKCFHYYYCLSAIPSHKGIIYTKRTEMEIEKTINLDLSGFGGPSQVMEIEYLMFYQSFH